MRLAEEIEGGDRRSDSVRRLSEQLPLIILFFFLLTHLNR